MGGTPVRTDRAGHFVPRRTLRRIAHPGPGRDELRTEAVATRVTPLRLSLAAGATLLEAVTAAMAAAGATSAVATLHSGALFPFACVMPALSRSPEHAVWYSDRIDAAAPVRLDTARITFGLRDGQPWLHCHARWTDADGTVRGGHLLPEAVRLAEPLQLDAWRLDDAAFDVHPDAYTRFSLFRPFPAGPAEIASRDEATHGPPATAPHAALAVRLPPDVDVCGALEDLCRKHGFARAVVRGGVGSTVGAAFDDGRVVEPFVTELLIRDGSIARNDTGETIAAIDVTLVDHEGGLSEGRLARGANAVLVTFELVLEPA